MLCMWGLSAFEVAYEVLKVVIIGQNVNDINKTKSSCFQLFSNADLVDQTISEYRQV